MDCGDQNRKVFFIGVAQLKGAWNRVMLTLSFKDAKNNTSSIMRRMLARKSMPKHTSTFGRML